MDYIILIIVIWGGDLCIINTLPASDLTYHFGLLVKFYWPIYWNVSVCTFMICAFCIFMLKTIWGLFLGGTVDKNLPADSGDTGSVLVKEDPTWHEATRPQATATESQSLEVALRLRGHRDEKAGTHRTAAPCYFVAGRNSPGSNEDL